MDGMSRVHQKTSPFVLSLSKHERANPDKPCRITPENTMILGLRTAIYATPDLARGREWYTRVLEREPYFNEPFYVGFNVGGFELGLIPDGKPSASGAQVLWGVPDIDAELRRLQKLGAQVHEAAHGVGGDIRVASVLDPFGNVFGLIENPHFDPAQVR
jgi:predicted enzyme related to lactoylglutathione lyase